MQRIHSLDGGGDGEEREREREEVSETKLLGCSAFIYPCTFVTPPHMRSLGWI